MSITTVTSREFSQDVSKMRRAALGGPVFITDNGHPAYVLLAIEDYLMLTKSKESIVDLLAMPDEGDIEFEPEKLTRKLSGSGEVE